MDNTQIVTTFVNLGIAGVIAYKLLDFILKKLNSKLDRVIQELNRLNENIVRLNEKIEELASRGG